MNHIWTPSANRPLTLYRVLHPLSATTYSPTTGFTSSLPDTPENWIPRTSLPTFTNSILSHLLQTSIPSPYISCFSSLQEAESWAIAAEDIFGEECYIAVVDIRHVSMKNSCMWRVGDVLESLKEVGFEESFRRSGVSGNRDLMAEWMVLFRVPGVAIRVLRGSKGIRAEREWKNDNLDTVYAPGKVLRDEYKPLHYDGNLYRNQKEWLVWEHCACASKQVCNHLDKGGFDPPRSKIEE